MHSMTAIFKKASSAHPNLLTKDLVFSIRKMISSLTRQTNDIDDIIQEVFLKVHKKGGSVDPSKFLGWLLQVSRTTTIDYYRKKQADPLFARFAGRDLLARKPY
jgi:DNA-directed RNA polymerase specialized sigma24 family protein